MCMKKQSTRSPLRILIAVLTSFALLYVSAAIAGYLPRTIWPLSIWVEYPSAQCVTAILFLLPILLFALSWDTYEAKLLDPVILAPSQNLETIDIEFSSPTEHFFNGLVFLGFITLGVLDTLPWRISALVLLVSGAAWAVRFQFDDFYRIEARKKTFTWIRRVRKKETTKAKYPLGQQSAVILQGKTNSENSDNPWSYFPVLVANKLGKLIEKADAPLDSYEEAKKKAELLASSLSLPLYFGEPESTLRYSVQGRHSLSVLLVRNLRESKLRVWAYGFFILALALGSAFVFG